MLCLIALLCAGVAIAVLQQQRDPTPDLVELRREIARASAASLDLMRRIDRLQARVHELETENRALRAAAPPAAGLAEAEPPEAADSRPP
jgi:phage shock protein A